MPMCRVSCLRGYVAQQQTSPTIVLAKYDSVNAALLAQHSILVYKDEYRAHFEFGGALAPAPMPGLVDAAGNSAASFGSGPSGVPGSGPGLNSFSAPLSASGLNSFSASLSSSASNSSNSGTSSTTPFPLQPHGPGGQSSNASPAPSISNSKQSSHNGLPRALSGTDDEIDVHCECLAHSDPGTNCAEILRTELSSAILRKFEVVGGHEDGNLIRIRYPSAKLVERLFAHAEKDLRGIVSLEDDYDMQMCPRGILPRLPVRAKRERSPVREKGSAKDRLRDHDEGVLLSVGAPVGLTSNVTVTAKQEMPAQNTEAAPGEK